MKHCAGKSYGRASRGGLTSKAGTVLPGAALTVLFPVLYFSTLAPTVLYHDHPEMFDPAMLQAAAPVLGIGHPTGYPTYMMLAHLFTYLPVGDAAYRVNLLSAVFGVVAVVAVYLVGLRLTRRAVAASAGALAFGLTPIFWSQAVISEVYTLNAAFIATILYTLLTWRDSRLDSGGRGSGSDGGGGNAVGRKNGYLLLVAFLLGLSLTHHLTSSLLIPAAFVFVFFTDRALLRRTGLWIRCAGIFALGLLPYLYLPIRAAMEAPLNEADPSTPERFLLLVSGGGFLLKNLLDATGSSPGEVTSGGAPEIFPAVGNAVAGALQRLSPSGEFVLGQFPALALVAGLAGFFYLLFTDRGSAALLGVLFFGWLTHALAYTVADFYVFFIPAYLIFGLFVACGAGLLIREVEALTHRLSATNAASPALRTLRVLTVCVCALVVLVPLARAPETYAAEDRSEDYRGRTILETVAAQTEPDATVLHHRSSLWYLVLVEERRRDLTLVDPFETSWVRQTDLVWPDDLDAGESAERYGADDLSGVEAARVAAERGPVYLLNQEVGSMADAEDFREAGFRVEPVGEDEVLYELVPRTGDRGA